MVLPLSKQSYRLLFFVCSTFLLVGLLIDQAFAGGSGKSGDRRSSGRGSESISRRSDRGSDTHGYSRNTSAYSGGTGGGTSRHSRGRSPGRSNSKARSKSKSIGAKMGRIADKMAVGLSLYSSASIKYIEEYSLGKAHEYVLKAAKYRVERYAMIDDIGYSDDEIHYYKEEWATRVVEVALGFHRMITTIYKAISAKKDEHANNVRHIKGNLAKQRSLNDRADPGTKAAYNFEKDQEEYVKEALNTMKNDLKYITEAEDIKNHMDLLSMFYTFFNRKNAYYKDYFAKNMMDNVYTIVMDAMDQIDSAYELVKKPNNRVRDPGTSRRIRDAVVNDIGEGSKQRSHSGGRRRSEYDSRYSYTYSRQKSGDRRRSGGSGAGTGQSSRYLTNG